MKSGFQLIDEKENNLFEEGTLTLITSSDERLSHDFFLSLILNASLPEINHGDTRTVDAFDEKENEEDLFSRLSTKTGIKIEDDFLPFEIRHITSFDDIKNPSIIHLNNFEIENTDKLKTLEEKSLKLGIPIVVIAEKDLSFDLSKRNDIRELSNLFLHFKKIVKLFLTNDGMEKGTVRGCVVRIMEKNSKCPVDRFLSFDTKSGTFLNPIYYECTPDAILDEINIQIGEEKQEGTRTVLYNIREGINEKNPKSFLMFGLLMIDHISSLKEEKEIMEYKKLSMRAVLIGLSIKQKDKMSFATKSLYSDAILNLSSILLNRKGQRIVYKGLSINTGYLKSILLRFQSEIPESILYSIFISLKIENRSTLEASDLIKRYKNAEDRLKNYKNHFFSSILNSIAVCLFFKKDSMDALYFWKEALRYDENNADASYNLYLYYKQGYSVVDSRENERKYYERYKRAILLS